MRRVGWIFESPRMFDIQNCTQSRTQSELESHRFASPSIVSPKRTEFRNVRVLLNDRERPADPGGRGHKRGCGNDRG
jgi:hypothetical protein